MPEMEELEQLVFMRLYILYRPRALDFYLFTVLGCEKWYRQLRPGSFSQLNYTDRDKSEERPRFCRASRCRLPADVASEASYEQS